MIIDLYSGSFYCGCLIMYNRLCSLVILLAENAVSFYAELHEYECYHSSDIPQQDGKVEEKLKSTGKLLAIWNLDAQYTVRSQRCAVNMSQF